MAVKYNENCAACYLNHDHTQDEHIRNIAHTVACATIGQVAWAMTNAQREEYTRLVNEFMADYNANR